jgi:hypothetical protein
LAPSRYSTTEKLWGEVVAAKALSCYHVRTDQWSVIPAGDTVLIYDRLTRLTGNRPWLHVNAYWNDSDAEEKTRTIYGWGRPQVNCYIPFGDGAHPQVAPNPSRATPTQTPAIPTPAPPPAGSPRLVTRSASEDDAAGWIRALELVPAIVASQWSPAGSDPVTSYPGSMKLPPVGNRFIADLPLRMASSWPAEHVVNADSNERLEVQGPSYRLLLGHGAHNYPLAELAGSRGRADFDLAMSFDGCELDSSLGYCAPISSPSTAQHEAFVGVTVGGQPAVVSHRMNQPNSPDSWRVTWYDPATNSTYSFTAFGCDQFCGPLDVAARFGGVERATDENRAAAEAICRFADTFVSVSTSTSGRAAGAQTLTSIG